ncbi:MAG: dimethylsulfoniopropionate demethylase [Gammaproteobacteria bacterium]|nr:dimethylsulfoniopropionate demethylase [Gammaproteobacteria bacterium]
MPLLSRTPRLRPTPFSRRVEAAGATAYTIYNHMLLPSVFRSIEEDYAHLKSAVQLWDVSCERQVELVGPDAGRLLQMTTPRDISAMENDQCYYIPVVDEYGAMMNDPVVIRRGAERYWVSLADTDMLFYFKGLARGFGLDVVVFEPDVSPLAIQGPKADELAARVFGADVVETKFFRHKTVEVEGREMIVARSGWSRQGGFEVFVEGAEFGEPLWDRLMEAGQDLDVRAGGPNAVERIEGGLLSYGSDITMEHDPFEVGLGKFCHLERATACLGHQALLGKTSPRRQIRPVEIEGDALSPLVERWPLKSDFGQVVGQISSAARSPDFDANVAIAMVDADYWTPDTHLWADTPDGVRGVVVRGNFWI